MSQPIEQTTLPDSMSTDQSDQSLERAVQATVDYLAWQADKAKIAELTKKVEELEAQTLSSKARKVQRNEEKNKRVEAFTERLRQWDLTKTKMLERDINEAELETAEWKKKYQERIDQEKMRAFGVSFALHEANEKLKEKEVVIEHMKAELVKARNQAMGIVDPPAAADSGIHPTSTTSHSGLLSGAALDSDSLSGSAAHFGPSSGFETNQMHSIPASVAEETKGLDPSVATDSGDHPTSTTSHSGLLSSAAPDAGLISGSAKNAALSSGSGTNHAHSISANATNEAEGHDTPAAAITPAAASSGDYLTSTMSSSGVRSGAALDSTSLFDSVTAHVAPSAGSETNQLPAISASGSAMEATKEIDASYRILELELKLALTNHRLEQATSVAAEQKQNYEETAEKLHSAMSEIVTLRKRLDELSLEIYLARAGQHSATLKLWNEGTKHQPMAIEISRTNHKLQRLLNEARKVLDLVRDALKEPMKYAGIQRLLGPGFPLPDGFDSYSISDVDLDGFVRLGEEGNKPRGVVEEAESYLIRVRMGRAEVGLGP